MDQWLSTSAHRSVLRWFLIQSQSQSHLLEPEPMVLKSSLVESGWSLTQFSEPPPESQLPG